MLKKGKNQDEAVKEWLKSLEEVAYDAADVLDELHYEFLHHLVKSRNQHNLKVRCFFSFPNINLAFRWRMASKIRDIKLKLTEINDEANELGLVSRLALTSTLPASTRETTSRQTDSIVAPIIGREDDESNIVEMLLSPSEKVFSVFPITGMGGLGKTTLAKSIYNKKQIDEHFEKKVWVCVSKKVPIVELFKLILVHLTKDIVAVDDRDVIVGKIKSQLQGKRCFLVLDDVWDHDPKLWDDFFTTLEGVHPTNGSWCLITTRLVTVERNVSRVLMMNNEAYNLGRLPGDVCWSILKEKVDAGEEFPNELEALKERVIRKCDGLPLAASAIGGLLRLNRKEEWGSVLESKLLSLSVDGDGDGGGVQQILKLSFDNLPSPYIKKCFAYCSLFPKDSEIERDKLIELWMAEGFLQTDLKNQTMEEIGMNYSSILLQSSLFEETKTFLGRTCYKMHDLVHDLAVSMSQSTKIINHEESDGLVDNEINLIRYLAVDLYEWEWDVEKFFKCPQMDFIPCFH